ncbi:MAG: universal stress protein [Sedimentisphaerales bacterium]|nr:universal stress protein [Sedimentisphaerales bacterium]
MSNQKPSNNLVKNILFCTDFSENAEFAFGFALESGYCRGRCTLYLLHVIPESEAQFWKTYIYEVEGIDEKAKADIDAIIDRKYRPQVPEGLDFHVEIRVGRDYIKILEFARENDIDLIVIGRTGRSALEKALFGNVTEKIARKADCAVLIVPLSFEKKLSAKD